MRWPEGRSGRSDRDDRPVPRCGSGRWHRAPCDEAMQDATAAVPRICCPFDGRCRPPRGWVGSSPDLPPGALHLVRAGHLDGSAAFDGSWRELALSEQIRLVLAYLFRAKTFGRTAEVLRKVLHRIDVGTYGALRVVATLEFIQHHLPKIPMTCMSRRQLKLSCRKL